MMFRVRPGTEIFGAKVKDNMYISTFAFLKSPHVVRFARAHLRATGKTFSTACSSMLRSLAVHASSTTQCIFPNPLTSVLAGSSPGDNCTSAGDSTMKTLQRLDVLFNPLQASGVKIRLKTSMYITGHIL